MGATNDVNQVVGRERRAEGFELVGVAVDEDDHEVLDLVVQLSATPGEKFGDSYNEISEWRRIKGERT